MSVSDLLFVAIRWLHNISAAALVGGGLFYLLVLRPVWRQSGGGPDEAVSSEFRALATTAAGILLVTGAVLSFNRLTSGFVGVPYAVVLAVKVALALCMFYLVLFVRRGARQNGSRKSPRWLSALSGGAAMALLGVIVFLLADVLSALFERGLRG